MAAIERNAPWPQVAAAPVGAPGKVDSFLQRGRRHCTQRQGTSSELSRKRLGHFQPRDVS